MGEVDVTEVDGVEETGGDGFGEVVAAEFESCERVEESEFGGDVAGESSSGENEGGDSAACAGDARPVAWSLVGFGPGCHRACRVVSDS